MQVLIAVIAFLSGAVTVFVLELQLLNDTLAPVNDLVENLSALVAALAGGA